MSKKIGITLIVVALTIAVAYSVVAAVTFVGECPVETTTPTVSKTEGRVAEVIYNSFMYTDGSYEYDVQVYVSSSLVTEGLTAEQAQAKKQAVTEAFDTIKRAFKNGGIAVKDLNGEFCISAVLATYDSATDRALASGETGYDVYASTADVYNGFWYSWYVNETETVFADRDADNWLNFVADTLKTVGGISADDIDYVFNYGTKYSVNTIASDADSIYYYTNETDGVSAYVHEFRMTEETRTREITLVQHTPNVWSWYLMAIVVVLIMSGIAILSAGRKGEKHAG